MEDAEARREVEAFFWRLYSPPFNTRVERCVKDWSSVLERRTEEIRQWESTLYLRPDGARMVIRSGDDTVSYDTWPEDGQLPIGRIPDRPEQAQ